MSEFRRISNSLHTESQTAFLPAEQFALDTVSVHLPNPRALCDMLHGSVILLEGESPGC